MSGDAHNNPMFECPGMSLEIGLQVAWIDRNKDNALISIPACELARGDNISLSEDTLQRNSELYRRYTHIFTLLIEPFRTEFLPLRRFTKRFEVYTRTVEHVR